MKNRKVPAKMINKNIIILGSKGMLGKHYKQLGVTQ